MAEVEREAAVILNLLNYIACAFSMMEDLADRWKGIEALNSGTQHVQGQEIQPLHIL